MSDREFVAGQGGASAAIYQPILNAFVVRSRHIWYAPGHDSGG
jgi:hypothetical protein